MDLIKDLLPKLRTKIILLFIGPLITNSCAHTPRHPTISRESTFLCKDRPVESVGNYWDGLMYNSCNFQDELKKTSGVNNIIFASDCFSQYGHSDTANILLESALFLKENYPEKVLMIGDASKKGGGKLYHHLTHQIGLDVDIAYLALKKGAKANRIHAKTNRFPEIFVKNKRLLSNFDVLVTCPQKRVHPLS